MSRSIVMTFGHCQWHQYAPFSACKECGWTTDSVFSLGSCPDCGGWREFAPFPEPKILVELHATEA